MNRSDRNRFKHFNFLVKFDLFFRVIFQNLASNLTSSFLNLAFANLDKFAGQAKFGKPLKFELPILNFRNLTAEVFRKFYKLRKPAESNFILRQSETLPRRKYDKTTESDYASKIQKRCPAGNPESLSFKLHFNDAKTMPHIVFVHYHTEQRISPPTPAL